MRFDELTLELLVEVDKVSDELSFELAEEASEPLEVETGREATDEIDVFRE